MTNLERYMKLFSGLTSAYGTGAGGWVKESVTEAQYAAHLDGQGPGLGIAPLRDDGTVLFAAIDLDEPDFETARGLADLLPGPAFIERSRSGNAHIFTFFSEPVPAWVPRGIMREACAAFNKRFVEVFPKQDRLRTGMFGNYINLPYFGGDRPIMIWEGTDNAPHDHEIIRGFSDLTLSMFLDKAEAGLNNPKDWIKRAHWLGIPSPEERASHGQKEFGSQSVLHMCAEYVLEHREDNPLMEGHRAVVYFALCKQFANCNQYIRDEALTLLGLINDASLDPIREDELARMYDNAVRGEYTSTGCDDPLFAPYAHPDCPIAHATS